jgi:hypothetical protein
MALRFPALVDRDSKSRRRASARVTIGRDRVSLMPGCSTTPIDGAVANRHACIMHNPDTPATDDARALLDVSLRLLLAAERLEGHAGERASADLVPSSLGIVEHALQALGRGCDAARALIPPGGLDETVSWRFARAAAGWPGVADVPGGGV